MIAAHQIGLADLANGHRKAFRRFLRSDDSLSAPEYSQNVFRFWRLACPPSLHAWMTYKDQYKDSDSRRVTKDIREFMVDLAWIDYGNRHVDQSRRVPSLELALESEYGRRPINGERAWDDVYEDFEKLLYLRTPRKVYLFAARDEAKPEKLLGHMERWILGHRHKPAESEQWLLLCHVLASRQRLRRIVGVITDSFGEHRAPLAFSREPEE